MVPTSESLNAAFAADDETSTVGPFANGAAGTEALAT
jgi:hypothetical protein